MIARRRFGCQDAKDHIVTFARWRIIVRGYDFFEESGKSVEFPALKGASEGIVGDEALGKVQAAVRLKC